MRYRVDTRFGYASFDAADKARAQELYDQEGIRLVLCEDFHESGIVLAGLPEDVVINPKNWRSA